MTLILRIENYDVLENGGPPWIQLNEKGACIGRGSAMDWILPDPARQFRDQIITGQLHRRSARRRAERAAEVATNLD